MWLNKAAFHKLMACKSRAQNLGPYLGACLFLGNGVKRLNKCLIFLLDFALYD